MSQKKTDIEFGEEVAGRTIVGGRARRRKVRAQEVPIGVEKVLYLAATDAEFHGALLSDRGQALARGDLALSGAERAILESVPDEQLREMVGRIDPEAHGRRKFIRKVAAAAIGLAATTAVVESCGEEDKVTGIFPDVPEEDMDGGEDADGGDKEEGDGSPAVRGTRSDIPEDGGR
jgi:hypothetical protein